MRHLLLALLLLLPGLGLAAPQNPNTDWLRDAKIGIFMHFLPGDDQGLSRVRQFDVEALAAQLEGAGAKYFVITLGQNSGYFISPNATYDQYTGYGPGERCSTRDLPLDLFGALQPRDIRLMLYLPCQVPNQDSRAQRAFGLREGRADQPLSVEFAKKWAEVIQEWSDRYGDRVAGWWFDGGYEHIRFSEAIAQIYERAAKHGNPKAIATYNPGVRVVHYTDAEDYTAGELNDPLTVVPTSRWMAGSQWHALTYLGSSWGRRDTRHPTQAWVDWVKAVAARDGVVTLDMGPNWDPDKGPVGALAQEQWAQVQAIRLSLGPNASSQRPPRLRRSESYFGIHFDFHAGADCNQIGKNTTRDMVEKIIDSAHPDYIQIDCKGHPGLSSYPTKVGHPAPGFVGDPLRIWREVTAERGVALYMHYSGVWDSEAVRQHPDWAAVNTDGKANVNATSFFSGYDDRLLIPQLRELAGDYGVDGAWVDGECWASVPDYGAAALKAFTTATGIQEVPRKPGEPHWFEFLQFNREAFRTHLRHYITEVKRTHPAMQLCSNWAFTDHMPEPVSSPVDWISGDFSPEDSVNSARFSGRYLAQQGKPWDLMAWGFTTTGERRSGSNQKPAVQLQREAAVVLAQGGGFQSYYNQLRDGSVPLHHLPVIAEVARFCRSRQPFCQGATPVPQIALLYSTASHYREINSLFGRDLSRLSGTLQALVESQHVVDVVSEHGLTGRMAQYPLIVVGECEYLEPAFREELTGYVRRGGNLLLVGPEAAALFASELGPTAFHPPDAPTDPAPGSSRQCFTIVLGKGHLAATNFPFSRDYLDRRSASMRSLLSDLVDRLFPDPLVRVSGSSDVDVSVNRLHGGLAVNLVNASGPHWSREKPLVDAITPVGPIEVAIRSGQRPSKVVLEPEGQTLTFDYRDGVIHLTVPRVEIHSIVMVEPMVIPGASKR